MLILSVRVILCHGAERVYAYSTSNSRLVRVHRGTQRCWPCGTKTPPPLLLFNMGRICPTLKQLLSTDCLADARLPMPQSAVLCACPPPAFFSANEGANLALREHKDADRGTNPGLRRVHESGVGRGGRGEKRRAVNGSLDAELLMAICLLCLYVVFGPLLRCWTRRMMLDLLEWVWSLLLFVWILLTGWRFLVHNETIANLVRGE